MSQEQPLKPQDTDKEFINSNNTVATEIQVEPSGQIIIKGGGGDSHINDDIVIDDVGTTNLPAGRRLIINESIVNQVGRKNNSGEASTTSERIFERGNITIGEALEATALTAGSRPVDYSDAAAIQAAEVRATGRTNIVPGGVAAAAQSAATRNARVSRDDEKTKLSDILGEATSKLPADKPVTRRDAEGVIGAELRNDPNLTTRPGGVAASLAAAARINQINHNNQNKE